MKMLICVSTTNLKISSSLGGNSEFFDYRITESALYPWLLHIKDYQDSTILLLVHGDEILHKINLIHCIKRRNRLEATVEMNSYRENRFNIGD